jgi:hypothetical protein
MQAPENRSLYRRCLTRGGEAVRHPIRRCARSLLQELAPFMQGGLIDRAYDETKKVGLGAEVRTSGTAQLAPRILNKFLIETSIGELSIALYGDRATRRSVFALQDQQKIVEKLSRIAGLEVDVDDRTELGFDRKGPFEHLGQETSGNFIGKGITAAAGGFCWCALSYHPVERLLRT